VGLEHAERLVGVELSVGVRDDRHAVVEGGHDHGEQRPDPRPLHGRPEHVPVGVARLEERLRGDRQVPEQESVGVTDALRRPRRPGGVDDDGVVLGVGVEGRPLRRAVRDGLVEVALALAVVDVADREHRLQRR
jgi:hypothetical protein